MNESSSSHEIQRTSITRFHTNDLLIKRYNNPSSILFLIFKGDFCSFLYVMNEETIAKQNEYLMALFGVVRRESGKHPIINGDPKQEEMYAQNMSHLAHFCSSSELSDNEILQFFSGSTMPVIIVLCLLFVVCQHFGSIALWLIIFQFFRIVYY